MLEATAAFPLAFAEGWVPAHLLGSGQIEVATQIGAAALAAAAVSDDAARGLNRHLLVHHKSDRVVDLLALFWLLCEPAQPLLLDALNTPLLMALSSSQQMRCPCVA